MWGLVFNFVLKFLPEILAIIAISLIVGAGIHWYNGKIDAADTAGYTRAVAEAAIAKQQFVAEHQALLDVEVAKLEEKKIQIEVKYRTIDKEIIKYVSTPSKEPTCEAKYVNSDLPFEPEYIRLLNELANKPSGNSEVRPTAIN